MTANNRFNFDQSLAPLSQAIYNYVKNLPVDPSSQAINNGRFTTIDNAISALYTAIITNRLDNPIFGLNALKILIEAIKIPTAINNSFTYMDAGGEQTIFEITASTRKFIDSIIIDLVNITKNGTIKVYSKIDGVNYREIQSFDFTVATDSDGAMLPFKFSVASDFKITYTESLDEGADRIIYYIYNLEG